MSINFNNINFLQNIKTPDAFKNILPKENSGLKMQPPLAQDCFQKSAVQEAKPVLPIDEKAQIAALYDKVFNEFRENNPILEELNYTKPELVFKEKEDLGAASYNFTSNTLEITHSLFGDRFIAVYKDEQGRKADIATGTKEEVESFVQNKKEQGYNYEVIKMNKDEKELFLSSAIAHELRHSLQHHLVASTKGCQKAIDENFNEPTKRLNEVAKELYDSYKKSNIKSQAELDEFNKGLIEGGAEPEFKTFDELQEYLNNPVEKIDYSINYKPKKLLSEDTELKLSSSNEDNTAWSVKEQLLAGIIAITSEETSEIEYLAQPTEVDAYYYQFEYLAKHSKNNPNIRKEVADALIEEYFAKYYDGRCAMEECGYSPLVEK